MSTLKTLLFTLGPTLGPLLIPRLLTWYRTQKTTTVTAAVPVQPVPRPVYRSFNILFISAVLALISTLPYFSSENIFTLTGTRLQASNDVLFTRLASHRTSNQGQLLETDWMLKPKLASLDSRLLYLTYGPDVVTHCPFCNSDEPLTYFYYALPSLLLPHLVHVLALGLATSTFIAGRPANRWRTLATALGLALAAMDCYAITAYDWKANARAYRQEDYVHFFWRMRIYRGASIAVADSIVALLLYLSSTNRFFVIPITSAERMEIAMKTIEQARGKLNAVGIIRNVSVRDEGLRKKTENYWMREGQIMGEVMDEREVVEGVRSALGDGRIQVAQIEAEARRYAEGITNWGSLPQMDNTQAMRGERI